MASRTAKPKLIAVVGPTASGKSALAMKLAKALGGEIVAADSWTIYKGFDIGSGKPSNADRNKIKHHLIDIRDPKQGFNARLFKDLANAAIDEVSARGKISILVGGTGLYIDSVLHDFSFLPAGPTETRDKLNQTPLEELLALAGELKINLEGIDTRNKRRVIRAIETGGQKPSKNKLRDGSILVGLKLDSDMLKSNIKSRVAEMVRAGLEAEVRQLAKLYGWDAEPMKGIGYKEWREYFEGTQSLPQTLDKIVSGTVKLAKRQHTWLKRNPNIKWFEDPEKAYNFVLKAVE